MLLDLSVKFSLGFFILLFLYYLICWFLFGKNPKRKKAIFINLPPEGLSPAKLDYIRNMGFDGDGLQRDIAASLINMATKGALSIQQQGKNVLLTKQPDALAQSDLDNAEMAVFNSLFQEGDTLLIVRNNSPLIRKAQKSFTKTLEKECESIYFFSNQKYCVVGLILTVCFLIGFIAISHAKYELSFMVLWLTIWTIGTYCLVLLSLRKWTLFWGTKESSVLRKALFLSFFSSILLVAEGFGIYMVKTHTSLTAASLMVLIIITNFIFYELLKKPTGRGADIMAYIAGFREYLMSSEELASLTLSLFEKYYAYAVAFQIEERFCKKYSHQMGESSFQTEILDKSQIFGQQTPKTIKRFAENLIQALDDATVNDSRNQPREFSMKDW